MQKINLEQKAAKTSVVTVSLFSRSVGVSLKKSVFGAGVFLKHYVQQMLLPTQCPVLHLC